MGIFFYRYGICGAKLFLYMHTVHLVRHHLKLHGRVFLNIFQRHIRRVAVYLYGRVAFRILCLCNRIVVAADLGGDKFRRRGIQKQIFLCIPVEAGIEILI